VLRESAVFLSSSHPEGFGLPPCEALACGCVVIGYHGGGGKEFLLPEFSFPIQVGDILGFVKRAQSVLKKLANDSSAFLTMTQSAAGFVAENYSPERERETIIAAWQKILSA